MLSPILFICNTKTSRGEPLLYIKPYCLRVIELLIYFF
nr:MAG TPA: hypothetical protein [Caudoviricetes sp.]